MLGILKLRQHLAQEIDMHPQVAFTAIAMAGILAQRAGGFGGTNDPRQARRDQLQRKQEELNRRAEDTKRAFDLRAERLEREYDANWEKLREWAKKNASKKPAQPGADGRPARRAGFKLAPSSQPNAAGATPESLEEVLKAVFAVEAETKKLLADQQLTSVQRAGVERAQQEKYDAAWRGRLVTVSMRIRDVREGRSGYQVDADALGLDALIPSARIITEFNSQEVAKLSVNDRMDATVRIESFCLDDGQAGEFPALRAARPRKISTAKPTRLIVTAEEAAHAGAAWQQAADEPKQDVAAKQERQDPLQGIRDAMLRAVGLIEKGSRSNNLRRARTAYDLYIPLDAAIVNADKVVKELRLDTEFAKLKKDKAKRKALAEIYEPFSRVIDVSAEYAQLPERRHKAMLLLENQQAALKRELEKAR